MSSSKSHPDSTLVVAVDGSRHSEKVVDSSCDLAKRLSAKIVLLFVSPYRELLKDYETYAKTGDVVGLQHGQRLVENAIGIDEYSRVVGDAVLSSLAARMKDKGVEWETHSETGNPAAKIVEIAKQMKAEMIVVGLHGIHGTAHQRSLGSVSRRVLENSSLPVVVVP